MKRKHTYQAAQIQQVHVSDLLGVVMAGCIVALDVAKMKWLVAVATAAGEVVKLFRFEHPTNTKEFLRIVTELRAGVVGGKVDVVMEPTGTYGDAVRHQLVRSGAKVFVVSPKRTHDSKELFDGVPSLHDAKSAVLIARLHAMGLSKEWQPPSLVHTRLRALVDLRQREEQREEECHGWLEASLARHWPELGQWASLREQKSALHLLVAYPSPAAVNAAPEEVRKLLRATSRGRLSEEAIEGIVAGARSSLGVPMLPEEERCVQVWASQALEGCKHQETLEAKMRAVGEEDEVYERLRRWMGTVTAAVLVTLCNPMQYARARQLEKGAGLNLREKSSGQHVGHLSITKRGPGLVRQMLYLFALRMIQANAVVRAWYERRRGHTDESKTRAVVAVMRKLVRAAFHVARGSAFDASKLFDMRRLGLGSPKAELVTSVEAPMKTSVVATSAAAPSRSAVSAPATVAETPVVATSVVATRVAETTAATTSVATNTCARTAVSVDPVGSVNGTSAAREYDRQAAEHAVHRSTAHERSRPSGEPSTQAPMALAELATAAKGVLAACAGAAKTSSRAVIPRTTPRPIARDRRRAREATRAST
jgi:transposase